MTTDLFAFERPFAAGLRCIPMLVRFRLDACGIKLSLKEWTRLAEDERASLATRPFATDADRAAFGEAVRSLVAARTGAPPASMEIDPSPAWARVDQVPPDVAEKAAAEGVPLPIDVWRALTPLQRFALCKLSRPRHDNHNFRPACEEFGIARAAGE